jgi:hypothetical protein
MSRRARGTLGAAAAAVGATLITETEDHKHRTRAALPRPDTPAAVYSVNEFCRAHRCSRATLYNWCNAGIGPRLMRVGGRTYISVEAAADWRREREAA